jgi:amino acid transporter
MASVLLVFQMGQPVFGWAWVVMVYCQNVSQSTSKYKTSYATIVTGFVVAVPALFWTNFTDLCSIGTLFAFVLVCAGVLVLQTKLIFLVENSKPLC